MKRIEFNQDTDRRIRYAAYCVLSIYDCRCFHNVLDMSHPGTPLRQCLSAHYSFPGGQDAIKFEVRTDGSGNLECIKVFDFSSMTKILNKVKENNDFWGFKVCSYELKSMFERGAEYKYTQLNILS